MLPPFIFERQAKSLLCLPGARRPRSMLNVRRRLHRVAARRRPRPRPGVRGFQLPLIAEREAMAGVK